MHAGLEHTDPHDRSDQEVRSEMFHVKPVEDHEDHKPSDAEQQRGQG